MSFFPQPRRITGFSRTSALLAALLLFLAVMLFLSEQQRSRQTGKIADYEQREQWNQIDLELAGLRIPYEVILYDNKHYRSVYADRAKQCKEQGVLTISSYSSVLRDQNLENPVFPSPEDPDSEDRAWTICGNDAFELCGLNAYLKVCNIVLSSREPMDNPLSKSIRNKDERVLAVIRLHVGRALKSKNRDIALASCKVWLAFFQPTADVTSRLTELVGGSNRSRYTSSSQEPYEDYSEDAIEAVKLIDQYSLAIPYPDDVKTGRAFKESIRP
ncbi:MAG: hypothetical protein RLZZ214_2080 [Verrucomicrobiota bacterium]|jgi:hypothetical protein